MKAEVFPAFWRSGIEVMVNRFFGEAQTDGEFKRTFLKALKRWNRTKPKRFHRFIREHYILVRLQAMELAPPESQTRNVLANPPAFALLRLITEGKCWSKNTKNVDGEMSEDPKPLESPPPENRSNFYRFALWVRDKTYPDIHYVNKQWKSLTDLLK
jgi:hypothetical protein